MVNVTRFAVFALSVFGGFDLYISLKFRGDARHDLKVTPLFGIQQSAHMCRVVQFRSCPAPEKFL